MMTATDGKGNCIGGSFLQAGSRKSGTLRFGASRELASTSKANLEMGGAVRFSDPPYGVTFGQSGNQTSDSGPSSGLLYEPACGFFRYAALSFEKKKFQKVFEKQK